MIRRPSFSLLCGLLLAVPVSAFALDDSELAALLGQRLQGDRTGACFAAAVVRPEGVARAVACANAESPRAIDTDTAFEIGSVSKTLNGLLLQLLIEEGRVQLDDPVQAHLPEGVRMPQFGEAPITLRHLLTHTSGLPSLAPSWRITSPANPYRAIDIEALHGGLASVQLTRAPGERFEYSNLGAMLLSELISRVSGQPFDALARERVFAPLGMSAAHVGAAPEGVRVAQGHAPSTQPVAHWDFDPALAGVGGVRASLNDMVAYLQAQLGLRGSPLTASIAVSHAPVHPESGAPMAMGWMLAPLNASQVLVHEGGTGGFSSFVAFTQDRSRGVVVLSDTAMTSLGGLGSVGLHLLDASVPLGSPRIALDPPAELLEALAGEYRLQAGLKMSLRRRGEALEIQAEGQPAFVMGYDSAGDFYPVAFDAVLRPRVEEGRASFVWLQGGGAQAASRIEPAATAATVDAQPLMDYVGTYPLMPGFALRVFEEGGALMAQATGQGAFALVAAGENVFRADAFGIEIRFARDEAGRVKALALHQGGQVLRGERGD
ncbi:MAG: serine hydrolase [Aquimonas sp.]|nr:serine hydrolase [Aquimonas sp.]